MSILTFYARNMKICLLLHSFFELYAVILMCFTRKTKQKQNKPHKSNKTVLSNCNINTKVEDCNKLSKSE